MKKIYVAVYKHGLKEPTKVVAENTEDAVKAAYAAYAFTTANSYPGPDVSDVVESALPAKDDVMSGNGIQPCVQVDCASLTSKDALTRIFA